MTRQYSFGVFDPRPQGEAANLALVEGKAVLGIEVTIPKLISLCNLGNIDPQHNGSDSDDKAAIEDAMFANLPQDEALLVTIRADLDSIGSMALIALRAQKGDQVLETDGLRDRVEAIAKVDKSSTGKWAPKELPTSDRPWAKEGDKEMATLATLICDFKVSITERVNAMETWLLEGFIPSSLKENYEAKVIQERQSMIDALNDGTIRYEVTADGKIAHVTSTHRAATTVGYSLAAVVIAENPAFVFNGGDPHRKITICQFAPGYCDIKAALTELSEMEPGWGGSVTIGGSPQGMNSTLPTETIIEVVKRHLM